MSNLPTQDELANALAWFTAPIHNAIEKGKETAGDMANWLWVVIQGDFAEEQTTAQIATGTVISMIPFVDQICDIRDLCANGMKIKEDNNNLWAWFSLVLTLIGLFPVLGSLFKGIIKVLFAPLRRFLMKPAQKGLAFTGDNILKLIMPTLDKSIQQLNQFIARPAVKKAIQKAGIQDIYKETAKVLRTLGQQLNTASLTKALDGLIGNFKSLLTYIEKWGNPAVVAQAKNMLVTLNEVRKQANTQLGKVITPVNVFLERLAQRIEKEGDQNFKVVTNTKNLTAFRRIDRNEEFEAIKRNQPSWVHKYNDDTQLPFKPAEFDPKTAKTPQHPSLGQGLPKQKTDRANALEEAYTTFALGKIKAVTLTPGEVIVRVIAPGSFDNSICWMRKKDFDQLKSRAEWRDRFAVWANWNANGEYVLYTVPKGTQIHAWEGPAASQVHQPSNAYYLKGGGIQLVIDPNDLLHAGFSERKHTGWGYGTDLDIGDFTLVGVPEFKALQTKMGDFSTVDSKVQGK